MSTYEISKSSLLSLKAEILRKQEDFAKAKGENAEKIKLIKKKTPLELKNKGVEERGKRDFDDNEQDLLKLSKEKLESKTKLYDKLSINQTLSGSRQYLVRFDKKRQTDQKYISDEEPPDLPPDEESEENDYSDHDDDDDADPSEQWVEYTDCLGRSRKCLRKDLEYFKSKDAELKSVADKHPESEPKMDELLDNENEQLSNDEDGTSHFELISPDARQDKLRQQWEREEEELRNRSDIHYQNILFNEARQHGVGYYAFSKDEEIRKQQQEALNKIRQDTKLEQEKAKELRQLREKQMAARIKAARNRRRARLGLPPEEEEESTQEKELTENKEESVEDQQLAAKKAEEEKQAMEKRKKHVRPWDVGKDSLNEHYIMSQDEWNEKKRQERSAEFAPPRSYNRGFSSFQTIDRSFDEKEKSLKFSTKKNKLNDEDSSNEIKETNYNLSEKSSGTSSDDADDELLRDYKLSQQTTSNIFNRGNKANRCYMINPYKNSHSESEVKKSSSIYNSPKRKKVKNENISLTVEAGLKYLREQVEKSTSK